MNLTNLNRGVDRHFPWLDTVFVACTATGDETLLGYPLTLQNESFNKCLNISKIKKKSPHLRAHDASSSGTPLLRPEAF